MSLPEASTPQPGFGYCSQLTTEGDAGPDQGHIVVLTEPTARMGFRGLKPRVDKTEGASPGARLTLTAAGVHHARDLAVVLVRVILPRGTGGPCGALPESFWAR